MDKENLEFLSDELKFAAKTALISLSLSFLMVLFGQFINIFIDNRDISMIITLASVPFFLYVASKVIDVYTKYMKDKEKDIG